MSATFRPELDARSRIALGDAFLRQAVRKTVERLRDGKSAAAVELSDWDAWRARAAEIRSHVLANLDAYLERFATRCEAAGGRVHFAADAEEAREHVVAIARACGAKLVAKSKSMVGEELEINAELEKRGFEALETDLGEWIVQLAHETPSHIILPAIHKSRGDVQALFEARMRGARSRTTRRASPVTRARSCASASSKPTWASAARTSRSRRRARSRSSRTRATAGW